jgi:hypothetical protein
VRRGAGSPIHANRNGRLVPRPVLRNLSDNAHLLRTGRKPRFTGLSFIGLIGRLLNLTVRERVLRLVRTVAPPDRRRDTTRRL